MKIDLKHGDCLELMKDIPSGSVDAIICDMPYGTTQNVWDIIIPFDKLWEQYNRIIKDTGAIVLFAQTPFDKLLGASNHKMLKYEWIWDKIKGTGHLNAKKTPLKNHENILVFYNKTPTYNPQLRKGFKPYTRRRISGSTNYGGQTDPNTSFSDGSRFPLSIVQFARESEKIHPTQKPVTLMEYLIKTYTNEGDTVLDNCMGSGTTGVACLNTNRNFIGFEMDKKYFDIATSRINEVQDKVEVSNEFMGFFN